MIDKDLSIIFGALEMISYLPGTGITEFPATVYEFKKVLYEQTDLRKEANNLTDFARIFKKFEKQVIFPCVREPYVSESVLVESFIDAKAISDYVEVKHKCNPVIAKKGMEILYRMIFYENFVHGDCHAGNILVQLKEGKSAAKLSVWQKVENFIAFDLVPALIKICVMRQWPTRRIPTDDADWDIKLAFIDAGMVTSLNERDQYNFFQLAFSVITRDSASCSRAIKECAVAAIDPEVEVSLDDKLNVFFESLHAVPVPDINVGTTI